MGTRESKRKKPILFLDINHQILKILPDQCSAIKELNISFYKFKKVIQDNVLYLHKDLGYIYIQYESNSFII